MKKITIICPTSGNIVNFRKNLIKKLQSEGYVVSAIVFDDKNMEGMIELGVEPHVIRDDNRSVNPLKLMTLKRKYAKVIKKIKPDIVFTFMMKPNIYGIRAARVAGVKKIFAMVEGAGDVFINNGFKWKLMRAYACMTYRKSFKIAQKVFFLNSDDRKEFTERKLVAEDKCEQIPGIGVDLEHFDYRPIKNRNSFIMIARMLKTKGIFEYCECARQVRQKYPEAKFYYLGAEGTVKVSDIKEYIDDGSIEYLGTTNDVRQYIENVLLLLLLSSYREGMPMSIMEAEAMGRGIITSNNVGCKDTVIDGYNGFLIERGDVKTMAEKVIWCIEHPLEAEQMGQNARKFAEENFDQKKINQKIVNIINDNEDTNV